MSESAPDVALEPDTTGSPVGDSPLGDGTTVDEGSARAEAKMVEASRFNGLMSKHQTVLSELDQTKTRLAALEARLQEKPPMAERDDNDDVRAQLAELTRELQQERLETTKARLLEQYPDAKPFSDLFVGGNADDLEGVIAAVATRARDLRGLTPEPAVDAGVPEGGDPAVEPGTSAAAPVIEGGGATAPRKDDTTKAERMATAVRDSDWNAYWAAKEPNPDNLA